MKFFYKTYFFVKGIQSKINYKILLTKLFIIKIFLDTLDFLNFYSIDTYINYSIINIDVYNPYLMNILLLYLYLLQVHFFFDFKVSLVDTGIDNRYTSSVLEFDYNLIWDGFLSTENIPLCLSKWSEHLESYNNFYNNFNNYKIIINWEPENNTTFYLQNFFNFFFLNKKPLNFIINHIFLFLFLFLFLFFL